MQGIVYRFDGYLIDTGEFRLQKDGVDIPLAPKTFEVLRVLVENHGQLVTYSELMEAVWAETFVEESNLRQSIVTLRRILGKQAIATIPKRGYRFELSVETEQNGRLPEQINEARADDDVRPFPVPAQSSSFRPARSLFFAGAGIVGFLIAIAYVAGVFTPGFGSSSQPLSVVAIAPFEVVTALEGAQAVKKRGLSEALNFELGRIRGLRVIKPAGENVGVPADPVAFARELGAEEVLTGTLRVENERIRVDYRLIRAENGTDSAQGSFVIEGEPLVDAEKTAALRIARAVDTYLMPLRDSQLIPEGMLSQEAHSAFLLARRLPRENDLNRWGEAVGLMKKVVEDAPGWARGHAMLAESIILADERNGCAEAIPIAEHALSLDENTAEAHLVIGLCQVSSRKWAEAESSFKRSIAADPEYSRAYLDYGLLLDFQRRFAEAEVNLKKAVELEPHVPFFNVVLCQHYYYDKKWTDALRYCNESQRIEPDYFLAMKWLYWVYVMQGRWDLVREITFGKISDEEALRNPLSRPLVLGDPRGYWEANLQDRLANQNKRHRPVAIATYYAMLGDKENTIKYLEEAVATDSDQVPYIHPNPVFDLVRRDAPYISLMRSIGIGDTDSGRELERTGPAN